LNGWTKQSKLHAHEMSSKPLASCLRMETFEGRERML
jgi:hypothetical protein